MSQTGSGGDPASNLERSADELEERLERLDDHIGDAQKAADARREEAMPAEDVAGDWEETRGAPGQGEDPEGAIGEHGTSDGATDRDATADDDAPATSSGDDATSSGDDAPATSSGDDATSSGDDAPATSSGDDTTASGDTTGGSVSISRGADGGSDREDAVGSRMPGHASGGDD
jgi:hypothetical protein